MTQMFIAAGSSATVAIPAGSRVVITGAGTVQMTAATESRSLRYTEISSGNTALGPFASAASAFIVARSAVVYEVIGPSDVLAVNGGAALTAAQANETARWASAKVRAMSAIPQEMLTLTNPQLLPIPARVGPHKSTGTVRYVRFGVGGTNAGTLANPYNSAAGVAAGVAAMVAGDALLFAVGSTATITAALAPVTGTSVAPIVIGVYDPATGRRISGRQGLATVSCGGAAISAVNLASKSWVCVEGLAFSSNSGANDLVSVTGTSGNVQVLGCTTTSPGRHGIRLNASGGNNVAEGNNCTGGIIGIQVQIPGADTTTRVTFNRTGSTSENGILVFDGYGGHAFGGAVACNVAEDGTVEDKGGIEVLTNGGAAKVYRNTARRFPIGIRMVGSLDGETKAADFTGAVIQNNDTDNNEFGILLIACRGSWVIEFNRVRNSGSKTGATWVTPDRWGRGIELFGNNEAQGVYDGIVRFNFVSGSYNWPGVAVEGTEGIGIGLDNHTYNVSAYGNYCTENEGSGFNINSGGNNVVFGNICVDNCKLRPGRVLNWADQGLRSEMHMTLASYSQVFNNTLVCGAALYGYAEPFNAAGDACAVRNNLIVNAGVAAIMRDAAAGKTAESHNIAVSTPTLVVNLAGAAVAAGAGSRIVAAADLILAPGLYQPAVGSACDGTGLTMPSSAVSFAGLSLADRTPIGALHPA